MKEETSKPQKVKSHIENAPAPTPKSLPSDDYTFVPATYVPALSKAQYNKVKNMRESEMNALDVAKELDKPIQDINYAFMGRAYEDYVRLAYNSRKP